MAKTAHVQISCEPWASCGPAIDCHQMTFLATRSAARILIMNLPFPLRPAVLLGRVDQTGERKSGLKQRPESCDISHDVMQSFSDWASFKGRIWNENVLEDETESVIG